jgi:hypothetical protein
VHQSGGSSRCLEFIQLIPPVTVGLGPSKSELSNSCALELKSAASTRRRESVSLSSKSSVPSGDYRKFATGYSGR